MGKKFLLKTDNMSLNYLSEQPTLNSRKVRWFDFLRKYHFELKHIKGKENKIDYSLSRRDHMIYGVTLIQTDVDLNMRIRMMNRVNAFYVEILKKVQEDRFFQQPK